MAEEKVAIDKEKVAQIIEVMAEALQADGGDIELIGVDDDGVVSVELTGACAGCSMSDYDLSMGVERILKERVPGITRVQAI
ncbi:MAG: NifU family protein [Coriobacteriia bacterium]|nr:NifU family protein [Coriobacteriia bacterium]MBS5478229.1 NifU family protein [Coriobacteriia bacterium]